MFENFVSTLIRKYRLYIVQGYENESTVEERNVRANLILNQR